jgi:hypothetical protein
VSDELPGCLPLGGRSPGTCGIGGLVGPRVSVDILKKRKISLIPARN